MIFSDIGFSLLIKKVQDSYIELGSRFDIDGMAPGKVHDLHSLEVVLDGLGISLKAFFIDAVGQQKGYRDCIKYVQGVQLEANPTTSIDGFLRYVVGALD